MHGEFPLLSLTIFLPLIGVLFLLFIRGGQETTASNARWVAMWTSAATFFVSLALFKGYDTDKAGFQFVEEHLWFNTMDIGYRIGVDGISLLLILLSTLLVPICLLISWETIKTRVREYCIAFLLLEVCMVGMFSARDALLFYVFFEATLIPMFLIIGIWGGPERVYASFKFFLYTLLGSILMLIALLVMYGQVGSMSIDALTAADYAMTIQPWLWWAFFAAFAVKVPMWPVHTWLPDAHVQAPTAGSVILAGVLLKMGGYGMLRFMLPMFPEATAQFTPIVFTLSVIAIIYTSLVALVQSDMKKLIAYSSVAHMGYVTLGLFAGNVVGYTGAVYQMISHGVISAALFICVGVVYDRMHTRDLSKFGGIAKVMPRYAVLFLIFCMASAGLPGTAGFVGEFLSLAGGFKANTIVGTLAATGVVLGAAYMLILYRKTAFGEITNEAVAALKDINWREGAALIPLVILTLLLGIKPSIVTDYVTPTAEALYKIDKTAMKAEATK